MRRIHRKKNWYKFTPIFLFEIINKSNMAATPSVNQCFQDQYGANPRTPFQDNFSNYSVGLPTSSYQYFTFLGNYADDAVATYDSVNRVLNLNSGVGGGGFTKIWTPAIPALTGGLDRSKYAVLKNVPVPLPNNGEEVIWESCAAMEQQIGTIPASMLPGVTNPIADPRIATSAISCIDFASWLNFSFYLTNEQVYAGYERLPLGLPPFGGTGNYHAFSHLIPVQKRASDNPSNNFAVYAIAINRQKSMVRWLINGNEVFRVIGLGMPIDRTYRLADSGGNDQIPDVASISLGFGNFTLLDMINPVKDTSLPETLAASSTVGGASAAIEPLRPLVELELPAIYIDPVRVHTDTGLPLQVGQAPSNNTDTFDFLVTSDATTVTRLFGNGALLRLKWVHQHQVKPR